MVIADKAPSALAVEFARTIEAFAAKRLASLNSEAPPS